MPVYDFINTKTGKEFTDMMSIAEKEDSERAFISDLHPFLQN